MDLQCHMKDWQYLVAGCSFKEARWSGVGCSLWKVSGQVNTLTTWKWGLLFVWKMPHRESWINRIYTNPFFVIDWQHNLVFCYCEFCTNEYMRGICRFNTFHYLLIKAFIWESSKKVSNKSKLSESAFTVTWWRKRLWPLWVCNWHERCIQLICHA